MKEPQSPFKNIIFFQSIIIINIIIFKLSSNICTGEYSFQVTKKTYLEKPLTLSSSKFVSISFYLEIDIINIKSVHNNMNNMNIWHKLNLNPLISEVKHSIELSLLKKEMNIRIAKHPK